MIEIKCTAENFKLVPIGEIKPNPKNKISFKDDHAEMHCIDQFKNEYQVKISIEDIEKLTKIKWRVDKKKNYVSVLATHNKTTLLQSRFILGLNGKIQGDHINGNPTDNRRENLRPCTNSQNMQNRVSLAGRKWKGYYFCKVKKRFIAQFKINGKTTNIGRFLDEKSAAIRYNEYAIKYYGEYAKLNEFTND